VRLLPGFVNGVHLPGFSLSVGVVCGLFLGTWFWGGLDLDQAKEPPDAARYVVALILMFVGLPLVGFFVRSPRLAALGVFIGEMTVGATVVLPQWHHVLSGMATINDLATSGVSAAMLIMGGLLRARRVMHPRGAQRGYDGRRQE
jgi:hypothetical protein